MGGAAIFSAPWLRMRIYAGGTQIAFEISASGEVGDWQTLYSNVLSMWFTTAPDQCGFAIDTPDSASMRIFSARQY